MEKIHNVGLINSKTPSQTGSFQGQQVTVALSLCTEGINVRQSQLSRPTDQYLSTFQGAQGHGTSIPVQILYLPQFPNIHMADQRKLLWRSTFAFLSRQGRERQIRPLELNSHSRALSTAVMSHQSSQGGACEPKSNLGKGHLRLNYPKTGY